MSSVDKTNKSDDTDDWVEVKILQGISHAFLQMMAFLPESSGAMRAIARWLSESLQETPDSKGDNTISRGIMPEDDEGLTFSSRPSTISDIAKIQQNGIRHEISHHQNILSTSPRSSIHISHSDPDFTVMNKNSHNPSSSPMHISESEVVLTPVHERERVLWEQQNILSENDILKRRRETLLSHLKEDNNN
jgi:hypothetical protein